MCNVQPVWRWLLSRFLKTQRGALQNCSWWRPYTKLFADQISCYGDRSNNTSYIAPTPYLCTNNLANHQIKHSPYSWIFSSNSNHKMFLHGLLLQFEMFFTNVCNSITVGMFTKRSFQTIVGILMFVWVMTSFIHTPNASAQMMLSTCCPSRLLGMPWF
jgi:hypothetical protein